MDPSTSAGGSSDPVSRGAEADTIRVLHVDDDPGFAELAAEFLHGEDDRFEVVSETRVGTALDRLEKADIDCVVSDYQMPDMTGIEFYEAVTDRYPELPFILFTGEGSEEIASRAISTGVTDYVRKGAGRTPFELLGNRIDHAVRQARASQRLEYQRKQYKDLFEQAPVMYVLVRDEDGVPIIEDCNDRFIEKLGYDRSAVIGSPTTAFFTAESAAKVHQGGGYERALQGEFDVEERTLVTKDGEEIETILRASPRLDDKGTVIGVQTLYLDVTEQSRRAEELERYETIIEASGDPVYTVDAEGRMTFINDAFCELVGYDEDELVGEPVDVVMDGEDIERGEALIRELLTTEKERGTFEMDLIRADGERVTCEAHVALLPFEDEFRGTTGIHRVITERKERERQLERQKEQLSLYEAIVEGTNDGVFVFAADGTVEFVNSRVLELSGMTDGAIQGEPVAVFADAGIVEPDDLDRLTTVIEAIGSGETAEERIELDVSLPSPVETLDMRLTALQPSNEETRTSVLAFSRDITEERNQQEQLERQNERLEEFASIVSHDLRNPLNVADGRLELAQLECESEHLDAVKRAHQRMQTMIEDLLTLARQGQSVAEVEPVPLAAIAENCWRNVETREATLNIEADAVIQADRSRFQSLLENLFGNAVEHGGDAVTITVGDLHGGGFFVEDDGQGIPAEIRARVFESGFSTVDDGTGFGLSIVRQIAAAHGWDVSLAEGADGGARFEVTGVTRNA